MLSLGQLLVATVFSQDLTNHITPKVVVISSLSRVGWEYETQTCCLHGDVLDELKRVPSTVTMVAVGNTYHSYQYIKILRFYVSVCVCE